LQLPGRIQQSLLLVNFPEVLILQIDASGSEPHRFNTLTLGAKLKPICSLIGKTV